MTQRGREFGKRPRINTALRCDTHRYCHLRRARPIFPLFLLLFPQATSTVFARAARRRKSCPRRAFSATRWTSSRRSKRLYSRTARCSPFWASSSPKVSTCRHLLHPRTMSHHQALSSLLRRYPGPSGGCMTRPRMTHHREHGVEQTFTLQGVKVEPGGVEGGLSFWPFPAILGLFLSHFCAVMPTRRACLPLAHRAIADLSMASLSRLFPPVFFFLFQARHRRAACGL